MSFATGAAIFNSCDKQGSIVQFTEHLKTNPNDYNALLWRAKAYMIVGNPQQAFRDLQRAITVSTGVKHAVAVGQYLRLSTQSLERFGEHANGTVNRYQNEWIAWNQLGNFYSMKKEDEKSTRCWEQSLSLATKSKETKDPHICWINYGVGNNRLKKGEVSSAKRYYTDAVESCESHTVSHIQLCHCNFMEGNLQEARNNFDTASQLNPRLSSSVFGTTNFHEYLQSKLTKSLETLALVPTAVSTTRPNSGLNQAHSGNNTVGRTTGGLGGASGGGGGNGSNDDDTDVNVLWKKLQKEAPSIKMYRGRKFVQSKCGEYWYSKDTARHANAQFKRFEDTRSSLIFKDSVDEKLKPLTGKHESREKLIIKKADMIGFKG